MSATEHAAPTAGEYIKHHLGYLSTAHQDKVIDFSIYNMDTIFWSIFAGVLGLSLLLLVARRVTSGVPGRFQAAIEILVELVEDQSKSIVHGDRRFIAPMALTIFVWVALMNSLDFLPVDMFSGIFKFFNIEHLFPHHRVVPTADLNGTLGIALGVFTLMIYYSVKIKGLGGFLYELISAPFGIWMAPFNLLLQLIEFAAKTVSLAMRLYGNMFAGELLFLLIALLGAQFTIFGVFGHLFAGTIWVLFHILIVFLQAFIFMMLTLVYMGQAHDKH